MKKACIVVDSSSGIVNGQYPDVFVVPLILVEKKSNGELISYRDNVDITIDQLFHKLSANQDINTSQANVGEMTEMLEKCSHEYENVFVLPIPETLSSNVNTWEMLAKNFNNVKVIRQFTVANLTNWIIKHLVEKNIKNELNESYIVNYIQQTKHKMCVVLVVPDIKQLVKGGRISGVKSLIVKLLGLKLLITMADDGLIFYDKAKKDRETISKIKLAFEQKIGLDKMQIKQGAILTSKSSDAKFNINELRDLIKTQ
jgi:DegV family protein with EDD domain